MSEEPITKQMLRDRGLWPLDEASIKQFQKSQGLDADGSIGDFTWDRIISPKAAAPQAWPTQAEARAFYGNPRSTGWEQANLVKYVPPWRMVDEDSGKPISGIPVHRKVLASITRIFDKAWEMYGKSQAEIEKRNLHLFSGSFVLRDIRGRPGVLSMHSYGIAIDIAAGLNGLGEPYDPKHGLPMEFVKLWEDEGWTWGGRWKGRPDAMHFQAASVS